MADGSTKRVADVRKGDVVRTGSASDATATVVCVVEHPAASEVCVLSPSGLIITPWHPVDIEGKDSWSFPANCANVVREPAKEPVFTYVLDRAHSVVVNGVRCVTLAHGVTTGDDARAHAYFGSKACTEDLEKHFAKDYAAGHVTIPAKAQFTRDTATNRINGLSL